MESKIQIDFTVHRQERILINFIPSDDLRDKLIGMFLQTATPHNQVCDGYCILSKLEGNKNGGFTAELLPIHPIDMVKHIDLIKQNADKFKTDDPLPGY